MSPLISYNRILARLGALRRRLALVNLGRGGLALAAYLAAASLVAAAVSLTGYAPVGVRAVWWLAVLSGAALVVGPVIWSFILFPPRPDRLALLVEADHPQLKNRLIASLQLEHCLKDNPEGYSRELVGQTLQQADRLTAEINLGHSVDRSPLKRWAWRAGLLTTLVVATVFFFPGATQRALSSFSQPLVTFTEPVGYALEVFPGDAEVIKFDTLAVRAVLRGERLVDRITFSFRSVGGNWQNEELVGRSYSSSGSSSSLITPDSIVFTYRLGPVIRDISYIFSTALVSSPTYMVTALDRPRVIGIRRAYFYPAYTNLEPVVLDENDGSLSALAGTDVELTVRANRALAQADIVFDDLSVLPMEIREQTAVGRLTITRDASYHFRLIDQQGQENPHPIEYPIGRLEDAYPRVEILLPGHDADLTEEMAVNVKVAAVDDFGFDRMTLIYHWLSAGQLRAEKRLSLPLPEQRNATVEVDLWWDLERIGMMPADVVVYHVEVFDNDLVSGPKRSVSKTYTLRLPSLEEMLAELNQRQDENIIDLEEILRGEQELAEEIKELHREMLRADDLDWQTEKQVEELNQRRQDLTEKFADAAEDFSENVADLQEKKLASAEMIAKLAEARQLFEEVASEEMKDAARQLAEAMEQLNLQEMTEALEDMEVTTEEMIERLDRAIAYFKKLQAEQKIDQMIKRAEDLAQRQENINEDVNSSAASDLPEQADSEDRLQQDFNKFAEDLQALEPTLKEARIAPPSAVEQFCQAGAKSPAPESMDLTAQAMKKQNKSGAQQGGQSAKGALDKMVSQMQELQQMLAQDMQEEIAGMLREALDKAMYLSEHQEDLYFSTGEQGFRSPDLRKLAQQQADLKSGAQRLAESIREISKKSMCLGGSAGGSLGGVQQGMMQAMEMLTQQNGRGAQSFQQGAMISLNQTAQQLLQGLENNSQQCQNPGSCSKPGGMIPQMQSLSNQQGRLNQQMAQFSEAMGKSMSNSERLTLSRLKGEQAAIQKSMKELAEESRGRRNLLGRLDKLGSEMKKVVESLEQYDASSTTVDRMRRIYSRMLDFQHSLHRQDYKEDRRARFGDDVFRASPLDLDFDAGLSNNELERLLDRYLEEGYPPAYETLIKSYYRELFEEQRLPSVPQQ